MTDSAQIWGAVSASCSIVLFLSRSAIYEYYRPTARRVAMLPPESPAKELERYVAELEGLGFERFGIHTEHRPLAFASSDYRAHAFCLPGQGIYADLKRSDDGDGSSGYFFSTFADGTWVLTANAKTREFASGDCTMQGWSSKTWAELLQTHRKSVLLTSAIHGDVEPATPERRVAAARVFHENEDIVRNKKAENRPFARNAPWFILGGLLSAALFVRETLHPHPALPPDRNLEARPIPQPVDPVQAQPSQP